MAKFNAKASITPALQPDTKNYEDGAAFTPTAEMALYLRSCSSFMSDKFYESANTEQAALKALVASVGQTFAVKMASYARQRMHLRSLPVMLLAEAAALKATTPKNEQSIVRQFAPSILQRADEPAELISYWLATRGSKAKFPAALKRGISDAMARWDEYGLAKYKGDGKKVKLRDVFGIAHARAGGKHSLKEPHVKGQPKAWDIRETERERFELYGRAWKGELQTPDTWETYISKNGASAKTWNAIAPKMGIFALVRNLRNFEQHGAAEALRIAKEAMRNAEQVRKSRMLPFRWLSALKALQGSVSMSSGTADAIRDALDLSIAGVEGWAGRTAVFSDNSGSMHSVVSGKSQIQNIEIAGLMAAMSLRLTQSDDYHVGVFGEKFAWVKLSKRDSTLTNAQKIAGTDVGHSTNAYLALAALVEEKIEVDRVLIFSDEQCYGRDTLVNQWAQYRAKVNRNAHLYMVNLAGYATTNFHEKDPSVTTLAGFSDNTLRLIPALESKVEAVQMIRDWKPPLKRVTVVEATAEEATDE